MSLLRITCTVPADVLKAADRLAKRLERSRSWVVTEALRRYVSRQPAPAPPHGRVSESVAPYAASAVAAAEGVSIRFDPEDLAALCRRHHISTLSLFGSVLRDDFRRDSDVDLLVEFEPERTPGFGIVAIERELSGIFGGHRVDLVTPTALHRLIRDRVLREARKLYVAA